MDSLLTGLSIVSRSIGNFNDDRSIEKEREKERKRRGKILILTILDNLVRGKKLDPSKYPIYFHPVIVKTRHSEIG